MKKLVIFLLTLCCFNTNAFAYEYSSGKKNDNHDWYDKDFLPKEKRGYSQRYENRQQPIQIYIAPNLNSYDDRRGGFRRDNHGYSQQYREERYWRERREELQQLPQTPYYENQFERDDTHW